MARKQAAVPVGVPAGDRRAGALGAIAGGTGAGVRALGFGDPEVGQAGPIWTRGTVTMG